MYQQQSQQTGQYSQELTDILNYALIKANQQQIYENKQQLNERLDAIFKTKLSKAVKLNLSIARLLINDVPTGDSTFQASYYIRYISITNKNQTVQQTFDQLNPWLLAQKLYINLPEAPADFGQSRIQQVVQQTPFGMLPQTQTANTDIKWQYLYQEVKNYLENKLANLQSNQNNVFIGDSSDISSLKNDIIKSDIPLYIARKAISLLYYGNMVRPQTNFTNTCELGILLQQLYEEIQKEMYNYFQFLVGQLMTEISQEQTIQLQEYISSLVLSKNQDNFTKFLLTATRPCLLVSVLYQTQEIFNLSDQIYQILDKKQVFECQQTVQQTLIENLQKELTKNSSNQSFMQKFSQMSWNDVIDNIEQEFVRLGYFNTNYQIYGVSVTEIIANQQQSIELMLKLLLSKLQALADIQLDELLLTKQVPYMQDQQCFQITLQIQWLYMLSWYNLNQETKDTLIQLLQKVSKTIGYQVLQQLSSLKDSLIITFLTNINTFIQTLPLLVNRDQQFTQQLAQLAYKYWNETDNNTLEQLCGQLTMISQQQGSGFIYQIFNADLQQIIDKCNQYLNDQIPCQNMLHLLTSLQLVSNQSSKQNITLIKRCDITSIQAAILYLNDFNVLSIALDRLNGQYLDDQEILTSICRILYKLRVEEKIIEIDQLMNLLNEIVLHSVESNIDWRPALIISFQLIQLQEFQELKFEQIVTNFICQQIEFRDQIGLALILQFYGFNCSWFNELIVQQKQIQQPQNKFELAFNQLIQQLQVKQEEKQELTMNNIQQQIEKAVNSCKQEDKQLLSIKLQKLFLQLYILINQMPQWQRPSKLQLQSQGVQNNLLDIAIAGVDDENINIKQALLAIKKAIE